MPEYKNDDTRYIPGYEGLYTISVDGKIIAMTKLRKRAINNNFLVRGKELNPYDRSGYKRVGLTDKEGNRKAHSVHRLVYETYLGQIPKGKEINHIDGNKSNNHISNLEAVTPKENCIHRDKMGLRIPASGESIGASKLTKEAVIKIRSSTEPRQKLARIYGVSSTTINNILNNKSWRSI